FHSQRCFLGLAQIGIEQQEERHVASGIGCRIGEGNHAAVCGYIDDEEVVGFCLFELGQCRLDVSLCSVFILKRKNMIVLKAAALRAHQKISHGFGVIGGVLEV